MIRKYLQLAYAFLICLIVLLSLCTVFGPQFHLSILNLKLSAGSSLVMLVMEDSNVISDQLQVSETGIVSQTLQLQEGLPLGRQTENEKEERPIFSEPLATWQLPLPLQTPNLQAPYNAAENTKETEINDMKLICRVSERFSDYCEIEGDIRIIGSASTILVPSSARNKLWRIKPYARKMSKVAMDYTREWTVKAVNEAREDLPACTKTHTTPAILFSTGGYSGNYFHDFSNILIPLFSNSRIFQGKVHFLATNYKGRWIYKFQTLFDKLSDHKVIDIDREAGVQCYKCVIFGLKSHKELGIDKSKSTNGYSVKDFRAFLRTTYSLKREKAIKLRNFRDEKRTRLMIISRANTRKLLNEDEISQIAQRLGYEVVVAEASQSTNVSRFAEMVNSCDVFMGVHGAGLTNMLFLPDNAVVIQVVPLGRIEIFANLDYGEPSKDMDLRYLSYEIKVNESSLIKQYPLDHLVFRDPLSFHRQGWVEFRVPYLENQDVTLDVRRFRSTLSKALMLLRH